MFIKTPMIIALFISHQQELLNEFANDCASQATGQKIVLASSNGFWDLSLIPGVLLRPGADATREMIMAKDGCWTASSKLQMR